MTELNQDAELALLNILMLNPSSMFTVPSLKSYMLSSSANQLIFSTLSEITENGNVPEYSLLVTYLDSKGKLREAGGKEYLDYIKGLVHNQDNLKEFERQVKENFKFRKTLGLVSTANNQLAKNASDVNAVLGDLKKGISEVEDTLGGEQVVDLNTASADMWSELVTRLANPGLRGTTTGFKDLDIQTGGYNAGDTWVIAARPSMGKSTVMVNSALEVAKSGKPALIFSLEMAKSQLVERMIAIESGVSLMDIRLGTLNQESLDKIQDAIKRIKGLPIYIDTNFGADESYYTSTVRKYKKQKDIAVSFLDYIQLASERTSEQTAELGRFSRAAKLLANELGITNVLYSQLNRGVEAREDKRPILSDLRQSGSLEEDADIVIMLYRDVVYNVETKYNNMLEFIIRKYRNGPTGTLPFAFENSTLKITDWKRK